MFFLPAWGVSTICEGSAGATAPPLLGDGGNLADVLDYFLRNDRKRFDAIEIAVRTHVRGVESVNIPTPGRAAERSIDLVIDGGLKIAARNASAGVRLMLFFITLAYHPQPPKLILFEEPENGVHPKRLADITRLFREITEGKHGEPAQIVLTTHSPYMLDNLDPARDQVLVFSRRDDGSRTAQATDAERLKAFLDEFMLGEVWFNQGEEGLLAKAQ
jgi:predicted ATPase